MSSQRIALITGASSGLGQECARQLAKLNQADHFILIARREDRLLALQRTLETQGKSAHILQLDLQDEEARLAWIRAYQDKLKAEKTELSWLVLAAGLGYQGRADYDQIKEVRSMIEVNIQALTELAQSFLPLTRGHALLFASVAAFVPQPYFAVYAASKAYVLSLAQALNTEYPNVEITAVCPNPVETEFFNNMATRAATGIKSIGMEQQDQVVQTAIRRCLKGRRVSLSSPWAKGIRLAAKLLPIRLILWIEGKIGVYSSNSAQQ